MKRSQLKAKKPWRPPRKPLNRVSKTNSRNNRDESVIEAYRESHPKCALCGAPTEAIHHIFGGAGMRKHVVANLLALCVQSGHGCHTDRIHTPSGKIECLYAKWKLGELDVAGLDSLGGERLAGWLHRNKPETGVLLSMWWRLTKECET